MSGYLNISALAFLMLIVSGVAMGEVKEQVEEKMIKGIVAMKEAIKALEETIIYDNNEDVIKNNKHGSSGLIKMIKDGQECEKKGHICSPDAPQYCCSGSCVPHPIRRIFVCA